MTGNSADQKARERELGELAMRNVEWLAFPPTRQEATALKEVLKLPRVVVTRPAHSELIAAGMVPYDCHRNCAAQVANDPDGTSRHVSGWLPHGEDLILHSVVVTNGQWLCLTPQLIASPSRFSFIPDAKIIWCEEANGMKRPLRNGEEIPAALRSNPQRHIAMRDQFMALVASGTPAFEARSVVEGRNPAAPGKSLGE